MVDVNSCQSPVDNRDLIGNHVRQVSQNQEQIQIELLPNNHTPENRRHTFHHFSIHLWRLFSVGVMNMSAFQWEQNIEKFIYNVQQLSQNFHGLMLHCIKIRLDDRLHCFLNLIKKRKLKIGPNLCVIELSTPVSITYLKVKQCHPVYCKSQTTPSKWTEKRFIY